MSNLERLMRAVRRLKEEKGALILAHNYQRPEVQEVADYVGDSLGLSKRAQAAEAEIIVFCGVDFMAETAKILNPKKKVLIPDRCAICPMALMLKPEELREAKEELGAEVVLYINSTAAAKAEADVICTSANCVDVVRRVRGDVVIFGPDKNMAHYISSRTGKKVICVPEHGICPTHHQICLQDLEAVRRQHPRAEVIAHPEVPPEVQAAADVIASTEGMVRYCKSSEAEEFIVATELGILHRLEREASQKRFYPASPTAICPSMKTITLEKLKLCLEREELEVKVPEEIASRARRAIQRMLEC